MIRSDEPEGNPDGRHNERPSLEEWIARYISDGPPPRESSSLEERVNQIIREGIPPDSLSTEELSLDERIARILAGEYTSILAAVEGGVPAPIGAEQALFNHYEVGIEIARARRFVNQQVVDEAEEWKHIRELIRRGTLDASRALQKIFGEDACLVDIPRDISGRLSIAVYLDPEYLKALGVAANEQHSLLLLDYPQDLNIYTTDAFQEETTETLLHIEKTLIKEDKDARLQLLELIRAEGRNTEKKIENAQRKAFLFYHADHAWLSACVAQEVLEERVLPLPVWSRTGHQNGYPMMQQTLDDEVRRLWASPANEAMRPHWNKFAAALNDFGHDPKEVYARLKEEENHLHMRYLPHLRKELELTVPGYFKSQADLVKQMRPEYFERYLAERAKPVDDAELPDILARLIPLRLVLRLYNRKDRPVPYWGALQKSPWTEEP